MNIENLLKEIDLEKENTSKNIILSQEELKKEYHVYDVYFAISINIIVLTLFNYFQSIEPSESFVVQLLKILMLFFGVCTAITMSTQFFVELYSKKTYSLSYLFTRFLSKKNLEKKVKLKKDYFIFNEKIDNIFLKKIASNMEKYEFAEFLRRCDGEVTLSKLICFMNEFPKDSKRYQKIENLTTVIYKENKLTHNFLKGEKNEYKRNI